MNIGPAIKKYRKIKGVRQKVMAKAIGISQTYLSQLENQEENPTLNLVEKICNYLGISMGELFLEVEGIKNYRQGILDATKAVRKLLEVVEWATYSDIETLLSDDESKMEKHPGVD